MRKLLGLLVGILLLGAGCGKLSGNSGNSTYVKTSIPKEDTLVIFQHANSPGRFVYYSNLQLNILEDRAGTVRASLRKKPDSSAPLDEVIFTSKSKTAALAEELQAKEANKTLVCDSEEQFGCDHWEQRFARYQKALKTNNFEEYYALGAAAQTVRGLPYVVTVTYNIPAQQYQIVYETYYKDVRVTFTVPSIGGVGGGSFFMTAKNRSEVESLAQALATKTVEDLSLRSKIETLYDMVLSFPVKD